MHHQYIIPELTIRISRSFIYLLIFPVLYLFVCMLGLLLLYFMCAHFDYKCNYLLGTFVIVFEVVYMFHCFSIYVEMFLNYIIIVFYFGACDML